MTKGANAGAIFLCGFMGAGKSTVGRILATRVDAKFFDTDELIVELAGKSILRIFSEDGEPVFRDLERKALVSLLASPLASLASLKGVSNSRSKIVVALGGGSLLDPANQKLVNQQGRLVFLSAKLETIKDRLASGDSRPLLNAASPAEREARMTALFEERQNLYRQADFTVHTDGREPEKIVEEIVQFLEGSAK